MSKIYLTRRARFSASHHLHKPSLSQEENDALYGKCQAIHGHNYNLFVTVSGKADPKSDLLLILEELDKIIQEELITKLDHQHLNELPLFDGINPTLENMVVLFWNKLQPKIAPITLYEVKVEETENNSAFYKGE